MNRVRTALLIASAALAGLPAVAYAQEQHEHHEGGGHQGGGTPHPQAPQGQPHPQGGPAPQQAPQNAGRPQPTAQNMGGRDFSRFGTQGRPEQQRPTPPPSQQQQQQQQAPQGRPGNVSTSRPANDGNGWHGNPGGDRQQGFQGGRPDFGRRPDNGQRPDFNGRPGDDRRPDFNGRPGSDRRASDDRRPDQGYRGSDWHGQYNRPNWTPGRPDWRNDRRYDWRGYRDQHRDIFRAPRYNPPRGYGWGYRPYAVGIRLQPFFFAQDYWIGDPGYYDLPPVYGPYRWVRYYNDVLLVDIRSGEVMDVIRDFFW